MQSFLNAVRDRRLRDEVVVEVFAAVRRDREKAAPSVRPGFELIERELFHPRLTVRRLKETSPNADSRFEKLFRRAVEMAPGEYIRSHRLTSAEELLRRTSLPTDRVAELVGFSDPTNFRRRFKDRNGMSAGEWREALPEPPPPLPEPRPVERIETWRGKASASSAPLLLERLAEAYPHLKRRYRKGPFARSSELSRIYERRKAARVWEVIRDEPFDRQMERVRAPVPFRTLALFDLLNAKSVELEGTDPERSAQLARLAEASLDSCGPEVAGDLPNRRTRALSRAARLLFETGDYEGARRACRIATAEWETPRPWRDPEVEPELMEIRTLLLRLELCEQTERTIDKYHAAGNAAGLERCRRIRKTIRWPEDERTKE